MEEYIRQLLREIQSLNKRVAILEAASKTHPMYVGKAREVYLSGDSFTAVFDYYIVLPQSGAADELATIRFRDPNVPQEGKKVLLRTSDGNSIVVKDNTGNIDLSGAGGDITLDDPAKTLVLVWDTTLYKWICYSYNA